MKPASILLAAVLAQFAASAGAATVQSAASYQLLNFSPVAGLTTKWLDPEPFEEVLVDGTGVGATTYQTGTVSADAATAGRSTAAMDHATAQVISRDRIALVNTLPWLATFGGRILPALMVSIAGNNDGQSTPEGLFGELATAVAAINIFLKIVRPDGTEVQNTLYNASLELGFGETGTKKGTGGGINGLAFASSLNPGETGELVFEISAISNAWHADPLVVPDPDPNPSPVPLPAGIALLPGALALLFARRRRAAA